MCCDCIESSGSFIHWKRKSLREVESTEKNSPVKDHRMSPLCSCLFSTMDKDHSPKPAMATPTDSDKAKHLSCHESTQYPFYRMRPIEVDVRRLTAKLSDLMQDNYLCPFGHSQNDSRSLIAEDWIQQESGPCSARILLSSQSYCDN